MDGMFFIIYVQKLEKPPVVWFSPIVMKVNQINPATAMELARAAEFLRYQNKKMEIYRMEEALRQERLRIQRLKPIDPSKGQNVDIEV